MRVFLLFLLVREFLRSLKSVVSFVKRLLIDIGSGVRFLYSFLLVSNFFLQLLVLGRPLNNFLLVVIYGSRSATSDFNKLFIIDILIGIVITPPENSFKVVSPGEKLILLQEIAEKV